MNSPLPRYAVVTPARNERRNLRRLARVLAWQTHRPARWVIVDNGSTDGSSELASELAATHEWIDVLQTPGTVAPTRGAPSVRALQAGIDALGQTQRFDVVVNLDADVSMAATYFERLLSAFTSAPRLGIASGCAYERRRDGEWAPRHVTGSSVWGASRAFRWECLLDVLPFEERIGWDGIDELKAQALGWETLTLRDLPFRHHRPEGARDGSPWRAWAARGSAAHYMGYRWWYLALRSVHHTRSQPAAIGMLWGYFGSVLRRESVHHDPEMRRLMRRGQSFRNLRSRRREALGAKS